MFHIFERFDMAKNIYIALLVVLFLAGVGCEDNQPVQILDESGSQGGEEIEVGVVGIQTDTTGTALSVDTTGLLQSESARYAASIIVSGVQYDLPGQHHEVSFAHAVFVDLGEPVLLMGRVIGFQAMDVGKVFLDGLELHRIPHRLRDAASATDTVAGVRYGLLNDDGRGDPTFDYRPNHLYVWDVSGGPRVGAGGASILSPGRVNVLYPTPDVEVSRERSLEILWSGARPEVIIISGVRSGANLSVQPLFKVNVPRLSRRIVLPAKMMRLLPADRFERFLFTFGASNSKEIIVQGYSSKVLLYVASVHNVVVKVR